MKIGIISLGTQNHATRRLVEATLAIGHTPTVLNPFGFYLHIGSSGAPIYYEDLPATDFDVVLPRLSAATAQYGEEVVAHFGMDWYAGNQSILRNCECPK